jgi:hypothetical protein
MHAISQGLGRTYRMDARTHAARGGGLDRCRLVLFGVSEIALTPLHRTSELTIKWRNG